MAEEQSLVRELLKKTESALEKKDSMVVVYLPKKIEGKNGGRATKVERSL